MQDGLNADLNRKTKLLIIKHPNKKINGNFKIKMDGKKLYPEKYVKYLSILAGPSSHVSNPHLARGLRSQTGLRNFNPLQFTTEI